MRSKARRLTATKVRSSIARRLGLDTGGLKPADRDVEGVALARMVPRLSRPRLRSGRNDPCDGAQEGPLLGAPPKDGIQRTAAENGQPAAERLEGKLTLSKWAELAKCSQNTALRDIEDLIRKKVLVKDAAGGRSTSYSLGEIK